MQSLWLIFFFRLINEWGQHLNRKSVIETAGSNQCWCSSHHLPQVTLTLTGSCMLTEKHGQGELKKSQQFPLLLLSDLFGCWMFVCYWLLRNIHLFARPQLKESCHIYTLFFWLQFIFAFHAMKTHLFAHLLWFASIAALALTLPALDLHKRSQNLDFIHPFQGYICSLFI